MTHLNKSFSLLLVSVLSLVLLVFMFSTYQAWMEQTRKDQERQRFLQVTIPSIEQALGVTFGIVQFGPPLLGKMALACTTVSPGGIFDRAGISSGDILVIGATQRDKVYFCERLFASQGTALTFSVLTPDPARSERLFYEWQFAAEWNEHHRSVTVPVPSVSNSASPNMRMNLTGRPVTRLAWLGSAPQHPARWRAQGARPSRPAGYARRYVYLTQLE